MKPEETPSVLTVENLTKFYGQTRGIHQLNFSVKPGEIFGFLGPNGAGKTTTIRLLLDLLRPTAGNISIFGLALHTHSLEIRRKCGYLPGSFSAYGNMSGKEFLRFAADLRNTSTPLQHILLDQFELSKKDLSRKIKHLSHGTRQKLGIVQAFFHQPELLILDEPTIGLDPLMQEQFYQLLFESQKAGQTIFFSSHNLPEVEKTCHRIAIIRNGDLVALESLENLKKKRFRKLKLTLNKPVTPLKLAETELLQQDGTEYEFLVKGDITSVLKDIVMLPVVDIVFPEPDLEQLFMTYYRNQKK